MSRAAAASSFAPVLAIDRAGTARHPQHRQREHRLAVAAIGGAAIPLGGLGVVLHHAQARGIELAQQRHRLDVVVLLDALLRDRQCGLVVAALECGVGRILASVAMRGRRLDRAATADGKAGRVGGVATVGCVRAGRRLDRRLRGGGGGVGGVCFGRATGFCRGRLGGASDFGGAVSRGAPTTLSGIT